VFFKFFLILLGFITVLRAESPVRNGELVEATVLHLFEPVLGVINTQDSGVTLQFGTVKGERRGFLNQLLIGYLTEKGVRVNRSDAAYVLNIEQFESDFVYKQESTTLLGMSDTYERRLSLYLSGWLSRSEGEILHFIEQDTSLLDRIRESEISEVEADPYLFLKGRRIETSGWARVIEPALLIFSVSTVVYLFFIMRS